MRPQRASTVQARKKHVYEAMVCESRVCYPCKLYMDWKRGMHFTDGAFAYCLDCVSQWNFALYKRLVSACVMGGDEHLRRYLLRLRRNAGNVWRMTRRSERRLHADGVREKKFEEIKARTLCATCAESSDWSTGLKDFKCEKQCAWDYFKSVNDEWLKTPDEHLLEYLQMLKEGANETIKRRTVYLKRLYRDVKQNFKRDRTVKKRYWALRLVYKRHKNYLANHVRQGNYF